MTVQKMIYAAAVLTTLNDGMIANERVSLIWRPFSLGPTQVLTKKLKRQILCPPQ